MNPILKNTLKVAAISALIVFTAPFAVAATAAALTGSVTISVEGLDELRDLGHHQAAIAEELANKAQTLLIDQNKPAEAIEYLVAAIDVYDLPVYRQSLGDALMQARRPREAAKQYQASIDKGNRNASVYNSLGHALVGYDSKQALEAFDAALAANPRYDNALFGKAMALKALGRKQEARQAIDAALALAPHNRRYLEFKAQLQ